MAVALAYFDSALQITQVNSPALRAHDAAGCSESESSTSGPASDILFVWIQLDDDPNTSVSIKNNIEINYCNIVGSYNYQ